MTAEQGPAGQAAARAVPDELVERMYRRYFQLASFGVDGHISADKDVVMAALADEVRAYDREQEEIRPLPRSAIGLPDDGVRYWPSPGGGWTSLSPAEQDAAEGATGG